MCDCSLRFSLAHSARGLSYYFYFAAESQAAFFRAGRAAFAPLEESKVVSSQPFMVNPRQVARPLVFALLLSVFTATHVSHAYGQSFTLTPSALSPPTGVNPGDTATATVAVQSTGGFSGSVSLSCSVTSNQFTTGLPQCLVSPLDVTPDAVASLTISTTGGTQGTQAGLYTIAVTGNSGSISQTATLALNVTDVTGDYTLSVLPTTATPSPVTAGNVATTTVTVSPVGSYSGHQ